MWKAANPIFTYVSPKYIQKEAHATTTLFCSFIFIPFNCIPCYSICIPFTVYSLLPVCVGSFSHAASFLTLLSAPLASTLAQVKMAALLYIQFYFITIATILGTGILGLPVTLAHSGFIPFLIPFTGSYIMQCILILVFTELLQIAFFHKLQESKSNVVGFEALPVVENEQPVATETPAEATTDDSDAPTILSDEFDFESRLGEFIFS